MSSQYSFKDNSRDLYENGGETYIDCESDKEEEEMECEKEEEKMESTDKSSSSKYYYLIGAAILLAGVFGLMFYFKNRKEQMKKECEEKGGQFAPNLLGGKCEFNQEPREESECKFAGAYDEPLPKAPDHLLSR